MAVMIPDIPLEEIDNAGERVMYQQLKMRCPQSWIVRYHYPACTLRGLCLRECEADFIVLVPNLGVMFIEVKGSKGWKCRNGKWYRIEQDDSEHYVPENPFFQASRAKHDIVGKLKRKLGLDQFPGLYGHMVAYPKANNLGGVPVSQEPRVVLVRTDLPTLEDKIYSCLAMWADHDGNAPDGRSFTQQIQARVADILKDECTFITTVGVDRDADEQKIVELTEEQFAFFEQIADNLRVVTRGGAGSGKTLIAEYAAGMYARRGKRVLLLSYNTALAAWLRHHAGPEPGYEIWSFLTLYREIRFNRAALDFGNTQQANFWGDTCAANFLDAIDELGDAFTPYDVILVDEAQDFKSSWWSVLDFLVAAESGRIHIFLDERQRLYEQTELPAEFLGATNDLNRNCRNTRHIGEYTIGVSNTIDHAGNLPVMSLSPDAPEGTQVEVLDAKFGVNERAEQLTILLRNLLQEYSPDQIAVLSPWGLENAGCSLPHLGALNDTGIRLLLVNQERSLDELVGDIGSWKRGKEVWASSLKQFKGLEADCVVLTDIPEPGHYDAFTARELYVAASRGKHRLFLIPQVKRAKRALENWLANQQ